MEELVKAVFNASRFWGNLERRKKGTIDKEQEMKEAKFINIFCVLKTNPHVLSNCICQKFEVCLNFKNDREMH